jgi:MFS family permease
VVCLCLPWVAAFYLENVSRAPLAFTLRKFVENPLLIGFLSSLNVAFNFMVGVVTSYMSDRIWTRWGRRRPLLICGWLGSAAALICIPLAPNLWVLVAAIVLYQFCVDVASPFEPLYNEVIPPEQRGRAGTIRQILQSVGGLAFFGVLMTQFDREYGLDAFGDAWRISGEMVVYWSVAALLVLVSLLLIFGVRETPPPGGVRREAFAPVTFARELFAQRQWWMVYLLFIAPLLAYANGAIGTFEPLLRTEQLGFTKEQLGWTQFWGMLCSTLVVVPLAGLLADRLPRLLLFEFGLLGSGVVNLVFYLYLRFVADYTIALGTMFGFGLATGGCATFMFIVWGPLIYDYIPRDRFGTVAAGLTFVSGVVGFLTLNIYGSWVKAFTLLFDVRGGGKSDYSSIYVLQFIGSCGAVALTRLFAREERRGRIKPLGRLESEALANGPAA